MGIKSVVWTNEKKIAVAKEEKRRVYRFSKEDSYFKGCEGRSPMSKWEMNVGWR